MQDASEDLGRPLTTGTLSVEEVAVETSLRPRLLAEYIGQQSVKQNLEILLAAARQRGEAADHVLLYGPPGLGKTTLANIIARELGANLHATSGPAIERPGDLAAILTNLEERDVLFIDEIHRLNHSVEEILYPAMEDFAIDVMIGRGPSARSLRLGLKPFTVVGATTRAGRIGGPLRDRFGAVYRLDYYSTEELATIIERSAGILGVDIEPAAVDVLARRGRGTPRVVNRLLRRVRDYAQVRSDGRIGAQEATDAMNAMDIDDEGLDTTDRRLLAAIVQKFALRASRWSGRCGGHRRRGRDDRGRVRAVSAPARLPRSHPAGPSRDGERARTSAHAGLRGSASAPRRSGVDAGLWDGVTAEGRTESETIA